MLGEPAACDDVSHSRRLLPAILCFALLSGCPGPEAPPAWEPAFEAAEVGWLMNVASSSASDVWVVGGAPDRGVVRRWDGSAWAPVEVGLEVPLLNWAMPFGADDVFVVGNEGTILRWNGTSFAAMESGTTEDLWGVWGASPDEVWAVGGSGFPDATATLLRWDGARWETVTVPPLERADVRAFFKVWGSSASDVWVVGQRGAVLHYDGTQWEERLVGASQDLIAVWGTGPDHVVMVGGRGNGIVVTWDGTTFRAANLAPLPGLNGVWMDGERVFHVAGILGTIATVEFDTLDWTDDEVPPTPLAYHSIHGDASGRLWAVGGSLSSTTPPFVGIASTRLRAGSER